MTAVHDQPERRADSRTAFAPILVVHGVVEHGDHRGRTIGFPTANLSIGPGTARDGVYAGYLAWGTARLLAAISVGGRPTFYGGGGARLLEAHVLDFDDDLYEETVSVALFQRLRGQRRFPSLEALVAQLHDDVVACRRWQCSMEDAAAESTAAGPHLGGDTMEVWAF